ncbi:MAG: efflux RND transporter periplasmic adaptor subunit [Candidatus Adiutrix sp.]|jgi:RND family efflux transporter MFP subunit|nr:efflux RND transporter periplasmic adaptor subunit [Candidatus Adiutrix sp.]
MSENIPKKMKLLFVAIPAAIVGLALVFLMADKLLRSPRPMPAPPQPVILGQVEAREITLSSEYIAIMEADASVDLLARVSGFLVSKNFSDGARVKKGQLLFQIEQDQYQALVDMAKADVISAQAQFDRAALDFNRVSDLYRKNASPKSDYDSGKAAYEVAGAGVLSAQANLAQAELNLSHASIKAPFDGRISDSPYSEGSLLGPESGILATVVAQDPILAAFGVSDKIISGPGSGADKADYLSADKWRVRLRLGNNDYYDQTGLISYVAPMVDPQTDTIKFKAKFKNPDGLLRPGQIVVAVIESAVPDRLLTAPKEAVMTDAEGNFVFLPKEAPADPQAPADAPPGLITEMRRVVTDGEIDRAFIIKEGLREGERIIVKGLMSGGAMLRPGAPIQLAPASSTGGGQDPEQGAATKGNEAGK